MAKKLKEWFDGDCAARLGREIAAHHTTFNVEGYVSEIERNVSSLELKDRVRLMSDALKDHLPEDYIEAARILLASLGAPLEGETGMFTTGYWLMPVARFVEDHGLDYTETSLDLCEAITQRHTSEYAVRPYIERFPNITIERIKSWATHQNSHVRRLASEGVRPRLPWARKLEGFIDDPTSVLEIANLLRNDPSAYVRKSVANLLNDVSKDHPDHVIKIFSSWENNATKETQWIIRHGARTLRKREIFE